MEAPLNPICSDTGTSNANQEFLYLHQAPRNEQPRVLDPVSNEDVPINSASHPIQQLLKAMPDLSEEEENRAIIGFCAVLRRRREECNRIAQNRNQDFMHFANHVTSGGTGHGPGARYSYGSDNTDHVLSPNQEADAHTYGNSLGVDGAHASSRAEKKAKIDKQGSSCKPAPLKSSTKKKKKSKRGRKHGGIQDAYA